MQEAEVKRRSNELQATMLNDADAEAQRIKMLAEAEQRKLTIEAEGHAQATLKEGQAAADVQRLQGQAQADVIKATGEAEAEAMRKKANAFQTYNEAAILDKLFSSLPQVVGQLAAPLAKLDKITVISTGGDGANGNGHVAGTGVDRITGDVARMVAQVPALIETLSGVKLGELLKALPRIGTAVAQAGPAATATTDGKRASGNPS